MPSAKSCRHSSTRLPSGPAHCIRTTSVSSGKVRVRPATPAMMPQSVLAGVLTRRPVAFHADLNAL
eukprot:scaffold257794_cov32-Tisochrysis_lutea.AAC.2